MIGSTGSFPPWPDLIAAMRLLKRDVAEADELFPATIPHSAATPEQLAAAEDRLGHPLDPQHRAFLGYCNGWPDFRLGTRLLSTEELGRGQVWEDLNSGLDAFYEALPGPGIVPPRHQICPISYDEGASDVFAIWLNGPASDGGRPVLWLPWQEGAEPYADFFEFFRASYRTYQELFDRADGE